MKPCKLIASIVGVLLVLGVAVNGSAGQKGDAKGAAVDEETRKFLEAGLKPFEPNLLWEKRFKEQVCRVDVAKESGDVIVSTSGYGRNLPSSIYLLDKKGKVLWRQGPMEEIHKPWNAHISDDGQTITYDMVDWDTYFTVVFYVDRQNKERWHKAYPGASYLSPDGSWVVVAPSGGTGSRVIILNEKREVILNKEYPWSSGAQVRFSEDSQYVAVMDDNMVYGKNIYWIFDRQGNIVLEFKKEQGHGVKSFTANELFAMASMAPESIYNLRGEKIITGNLINISGDGKVAIKAEWDRVETGWLEKLEIIAIPSLKLVKSYQISVADVLYPLNVSFNGRYVVLGPDRVTSREVFILDTAKDAFWKVKLIVPSDEIVRKSSPNCQHSRGIFFTKDEKYMAVHVVGENAEHTIQYYQIH